MSGAPPVTPPPPPARRKVLFLIPTLTGGGAERVIVTLLRHLDRAKFEPSLAVVDLRGAAFLQDLPPDIEFVDLRARRVRYALPAILRLIWQRRPDIAFSTLGHLNLALAMAHGLLPRGVRTVARESIVVSENFKRMRAPRLWAWLYRRFYRRHDLVVCQSGDMFDDLTGRFGVPPARCVTIRNPVDVERIRHSAGADLAAAAASPDAVRLVAAGRLDSQKGFDLLIEAVALLADPRLELVVLGEGHEEAALRELARQRGVGPQVRFAGFQSNPYAWIAAADAFVLSSRYEGFPNVVLEALACGTPVIATPAPGGVRELLGHRQDCVIAEAITAAALADAIRLWLGGPRARVPADAVDAYTVQRIVGEYEAILQ